jgi:formate C-acetyltransferase
VARGAALRADEAAGGLEVLRVQRTCVHDGPGLRTTIFFRGCGLRCAWCQNPEALVEATGEQPGERMSVAQVVELASRDKEFYARTGGGVTLSGGDPLLRRPAELLPLLEALKAAGLHVAVETALHVPWSHVERVAPWVDLFLVDLKLVGDEARHREYTGQGTRLIHANLRKLVRSGAALRFRMVMVPGRNDGDAQLRAAAELLKAHGHQSLELLQYHSMYEDKARRLGLERESLGISPEQARASVTTALERFRGLGVQAFCVALDQPRHRAEFPKRVHDIQDAIRGSGYSLCFEASRLKTEYYRRHGFDRPSHVHRAQRLAHVLAHKQVIVYPGELLVGNFTARRRGGHLWEEHTGTLMLLILHQIHRQTPIPFQCSWQDRLDFCLNIAPLWLRHSLFAKVYSTPRKFLAALARCSEMSTGFNNNMASIAHFIVNYPRLLESGTSGLLREVNAARKEKPKDNQDFYDGVEIALRALEAFAERYADHLQGMAREESDPARRAELEELSGICRRVPRLPAATYHEALQSMLFLHVALCLESFENAVSPGRLDQILNPYYLRDKAAGIIDYQRARELLALFVLKLDECVLVNDGDTYLRIGRLFETMSTDQTITAGGLGPDGRDATNELTYALLDICELQPYAANMTARIHRGSPQEYLDRLAEVYLNGSPMPALYNDELYVDTLRRHYDTTLEDARNYAIVGCVEPNASDDHFGNTDCANLNVALPFLQALRGEEHDLWNVDLPDQLEQVATKATRFLCVERPGSHGRAAGWLASGYGRARALYKRLRRTAPRPPASMEELLERFQARLNHLARAVLADHQRIEAILRADFPIPLASSLSRGCLESGRDLNDGGAAFNSSGIQAVGITDVADSLHALDQVVFKQRRWSLLEVLEAMEHDFQGPRRQRIREALLAVPKFGEDGSQVAVEWVNRTLGVYVNALKQVPGCPRGGIYTAGYYALNVSDVYGKQTPALPSGRLGGVPLANSVAPHYGMAANDLLSALNSVSGVDFARYAPNGTTVTFTIDSALFQGPEGVRNLSAIFRTFLAKGGMQFQPNVLNRQVLLDAYQHPERYPYLLVRVAGYCAYFNHLSDDLKKIIINRTCYA